MIRLELTDQDFADIAEALDDPATLEAARNLLLGGVLEVSLAGIGEGEKGGYGKAKRSAQEVIRRIRLKALRGSLSGCGQLFEDVLPAEFLLENDKTKRNRHFGAIPVFWAWLGQILEQNASCSRALSLIQAWCAGAGLEPPVGDTSSYCRYIGVQKF